jgi:REP element-mobilizing transposase RayT
VTEILSAQAPRFSHGVASHYRSNRNVVFSCKFHIVWCPKYRRSVLVDGADERLKKIIARVCEARNAQLIELEVMPDHVGGAPLAIVKQYIENQKHV